MIDLKLLREDPEKIHTAILNKKINLDLNELLSLDTKVSKLKQEIQKLAEQKNLIAQQVPKAEQAERASLIAKGKDLNKTIEIANSDLKALEQQLLALCLLVPNIPDPAVPIGDSEADNVEIKRVGEIPKIHENFLDHIQLLELNNWADLTRIANVSGSRSYALKNEMVLLEMALLQFALKKLIKQGFTLITVPSLARESAFIGTGHFPAGKEQVYFIPEDHLYLTGTAEVVLNALHSNENLTSKDLPILYAGFSPCFRREAGSAGKDTKGLIRVHQFYKVEQFVICKNSVTEAKFWHNKLLEIAEEIMQDLELPYRVVDICTGDLGAGKVRQYDLEAWVPSEQCYRETHSCSSLYDWQARRINLRYRDLATSKMQYCYTLNNTAIATPRILVPFLENHQNKDGSIKIPVKLQTELSGLTVLAGKK